jgi:hypothetical protein
MLLANWLFELYFTHAVVSGFYSRPFVSIRGCSIGLLPLDAPRPCACRKVSLLSARQARVSIRVCYWVVI